MARMDTRMPLMVQQPDFVNALARSSQAAAQTNAVQDRNALRQLYQTQGADIAAGKPGAINALAGLDPMAALGVQDARQGMAARAELMEQRRVAAKRQTAEYAATLDAREQAELAKRMETGIARGIGMYQAKDLPGLNELLVGIGEEPIQSLDEFPAIAALYGDSLGKLKEVMAINAPPQPGNDYERYAAREQAAGRQPLDEFAYAQKKRAPEKSRAVFDAEGNPVYFEGDPNQFQEFGTKASNDIEGRILNSGAMLNRLNDTRALFKPEYLEFGTRVGAEWGRLKDKMGTATAEEQALVGEFSRFKSEAFNNLNTTLKELSGAAVTPQEAERLNEQLPNAGTGIFDGDSPVEFQAKLEQAIKQQKLAVARYNLWLSAGRTGKPWDLGRLNDVPALLNQRGQQIEAEIRAQGLTDEATIQKMTEQQLRKEAGI